MITDPDQVEALIVSTKTLIEEDGLDISLFRYLWTETPAGGIVRAGEPTEQPAVRRFFGAASADPPRVIRDEGEMVVLRHVLIGLPGDEIEQKDFFFIGLEGRKYEVIDMDPDRTWQTKAWCIERA